MPSLFHQQELCPSPFPSKSYPPYLFSPRVIPLTFSLQELSPLPFPSKSYPPYISLQELCPLPFSYQCYPPNLSPPRIMPLTFPLQELCPLHFPSKSYAPHLLPWYPICARNSILASDSLEEVSPILQEFLDLVHIHLSGFSFRPWTPS